MEAPCKGPWVEFPPLGENLVCIVKLAQGFDPSVQEHADPTPASFSHVASKPSSLSRFTLPLEVVNPLAKVQKLEVQMATLVHHIQSWIQKSTDETEERIKKWVSKQMEQQILAVHKCLNQFELHILA